MAMLTVLVPVSRCCLSDALSTGGAHVPGSVLTVTPTTSLSSSPQQDSITFLIKALYGGGAGEMAQLVRARAALVEDLVSGPMWKLTTVRMAVPGDLKPPGLHGHQTHT